MTARLFSFTGDSSGPWRVTSMHSVVGEALSDVQRLTIATGAAPIPADAKWTLRGLTSNERYVTRPEKEQLLARQEGLGRPGSTCAALIPLRKSPAWWALTQDERRAIFEESSRHITIGLKYLPAVARRLHHCRDLGENEPFDFLTWFEFEPAYASAFDALAAELRASVEWTFVNREVDIRLVRDSL